MSETKWTPGPWSMRRNAITDWGYKCSLIADNYKIRIGEIELHHEANARLIAAAPDLVEALEKLLACHADPAGFDADRVHDPAYMSEHIDRCDKQVADAVAAARSALARAKGEKP